MYEKLPSPGYPGLTLELAKHFAAYVHVLVMVKQSAYSHRNYATEILMNGGHNCRVNYCGIARHLSVRLLILLCS